MGRLESILLILLTIGLLAMTSKSTTNSDLCGLDNTAWQEGEMLRYKLYYNLSFIWIPAGEVTFHLNETDTTYVADIEGRSYGSYDNIFRVRDRFRSTIDKFTMRPLSFVRKVEEGKNRRFDSLTFDYKYDKIYSLNGDSIQVAQWDTVGLASCTEDLVSIMYNLRNIDIDNYNKGDRINSKIFFDKEYSPISIDYLKKEKKKVKNLGKFESIKIRPKVIIGSVFKENDIMNVWVSDDKNKIPLTIESPIRVGSVKAILIDYSGLKYELKEN